MKRREKNDIIKRMADAIDDVLVSNTPSAEKAALMISLLKECDEGMYIDHSKRGYHALIKSGKIILERTVDG